jgi:cell division protein FtsN
MSRVAGIARRHQRGGTVVGLMIGLLLGLAIAVVVAIFVTQGQLPFVNKIVRPGERPGEAKSATDLPDPNRPLQSKDRPAPAPTEPVDGTPRPATEGKAAEVRGDEARPPAEAAGTEAARDERSTFLLQAGSFRTLDDAEGMRARLALLGYEARVISADVNGQTMYRVRLGPFAKVDDVNQAKSRLADNGIESAVMRQR